MESAETAVEASLITVGMRVLSRDHRQLGTVENVDDTDFTMIDKESGASATVSFELVESIDEAVHLLVGPSGLDSA